MAVNKLQLKRSAVPGKIPTTSSLDLGELAINTFDGKVFLKKDNGVQSIVEIGSGGGGTGTGFPFTGSAFISGSLTITGSVTATQGFSGSLFGTASWAVNAISSSFALTASFFSGSISNAISSSYASNADLFDGLDSTQFVQTGSFNNYTSSINAFSASILSYTASNNANIISLNAQTASLLNFSSSINNFSSSILLFTSSLNSRTGSFATTGSNIFRGTQTITGSLLITGSITVSGSIINTLTASFAISASQAISASFAATASFFSGSISNAISSSYALTASFANTASVALQVSTSISTQNLLHNVLFVDTSGPGFIQVDGGLRYNPNIDTLVTTASLASTASFTPNALVTASVSSNTITFTKGDGTTFPITVAGGGGSTFPFTGSAIITGSLILTGSANITGNISASTIYISGSGVQRLTIVGSGSAQPLFLIQGSQGELFSITDSLSGSLFVVSDASGLPVVEAFSNGTVLMGSYYAPSYNTTNLIPLSSTSSINLIASVPTASYDGLFIDYVVKLNTASRAGTFMVTWSGSSAVFSDYSTTSFGNTSGVNFTASISGSNLVITGSTSTPNWKIKSIIRGI